MSFSEIIPALQALPTGDKLRAIGFLSEELEKERLLSMIPVGSTVPFTPPIEVIDPEGHLTQILKELGMNS